MMSIKPFLWGASQLFGWAQGVNRYLIRTRRRKAPLPTVSIGGLIAGGAGKTPLAIHIAAQFPQSAVLLRGYRSLIEEETVWVEEDLPVEVCGDEAKLLAQKLPKSRIIVGKDRYRSALLAQELGANLLILDDGWQQRYLAADLSFVVLHRHLLLGKEAFLPYGFLRESPKRLGEVDAIFINYVANEEELTLCRQELNPWTDAPLIGMQPVLDVDSAFWLQGEKVALFCALGQPQGFIDTVTAAGGEIVALLLKPDHAFFSYEELALFFEEAEKKGATRLVCTEKEGVKLSYDLLAALSISPLKMQLEITAGHTAYLEALHSIRHLLAGGHDDTVG